MPKSKPKLASPPELFAYTKTERQAILAVLERARPDCSQGNALSHNDVLSGVKGLARRALIQTAASTAHPRPYAGPVHADLKRLTVDSEKLVNTLSKVDPYAVALLNAELDTARVFPVLFALLQSVRDAAARQAVPTFITRKKLEKTFALYRKHLPAETHSMLNRIEQASLRSADLRASRRNKSDGLFQFKGRRRNEQLQEFVLGLAVLYYNATGTSPTRQVDESGLGSGPFHTFVEACVRPTRLLQGGETVDHYVRLACDRLTMTSREWTKEPEPGLPG